jgi:hypothetical protein
MTAAPEPDDIIPPRDPSAYSPLRRSGVQVSAVAALCVICVILGFAGAQFARTLGGAEPRQPSAPLADLEAVPPNAPDLAGPAPSTLPVTPAAAGATTGLASDSALAALEGRVVELEDSQRRVLSAASASLAAAALAEAAQTSRPFDGEMAALERTHPLTTDLRALRPLSETGVPSRAALAAEFSHAAAQAARAARMPAEKAGLMDQLTHALSAVVTLRRVGSVTGDSPDAVLSLAERQVGEGDLDAALTSLRRLPPPALEAIAPWRVRAQQRVTVDRTLSAIRAEALADLMRVQMDARP